MTAQSWFKFYPSDWHGDAKLQACSLAARGLWIELICIMTEATPYGHLVFNDKPMSYYRIAQLVRAERKQVQRLVAHLKTRGVFGVTSRGVLYSKRMVRDKAKSEAGKEFIKRRWGEKPITPDTRKKERGQPIKASQAQHAIVTTFAKAMHWTYAEALDVLTAHPEICDRATRAEMRKPGDGVQVIVVALQKLKRGVTP